MLKTPILPLILLSLAAAPPAAEQPIQFKTWFADEFDHKKSEGNWIARSATLKVADGKGILRAAGSSGELISEKAAEVDFAASPVMTVQVDKAPAAGRVSISILPPGGAAVTVWENLPSGFACVNLAELLPLKGKQPVKVKIAVTNGAEAVLEYLRIGRTTFDAPPDLVKTDQRPAAINQWKHDFSDAAASARWTRVGGLIESANGRGAITRDPNAGGVLSPPITMDFGKPVDLKLKVAAAPSMYLVKLYDVASDGPGIIVLGECTRSGELSVPLAPRTGWNSSVTFRVLVAATGPEEPGKVLLDSIAITTGR